MRILFITDNFPPEVNAPATRTYEHCSEWVKQGVEITVLTCAPNFPHGRVYEGYRNKLFQKEQMNGINVIRVWSFITSNSGFSKRILDYVSFAFMAFWVGLFQKHDVIIATSPQFFTTWVAWGIAKIRRKPWVFELRDLWPESIKAVGAIKHERLLRWLEKVELGLYRSANSVVVVSPAFKTNLISRGITPEKIEVVTNGANLNLFQPRDKDIRLLSELSLQNKFVIGYIGTHGLAHSLDFIVKSISQINDEDIHFLFIGDGAEKQKIVQYAKSEGMNNITFLEPIAKEELPRYMSVIDVSLAPLKKSDTFKTVIPSKIFEASAMLKPTLLGVEGQAQELLEHYGAGVCFKPEDQQDFIKKVLLLKNNFAVYETCQNGCEVIRLDYDRDRLASTMLSSIRKLAKL